MGSRRVLGIALVCALAAACGGSSSASNATTSPTPVTPGISACAAISGASSSATVSPSIVNGTECSTANSPVVLVNLRAADGGPLGSCSGTVIGPRSVLTAAHCLSSDVASVQIFLGGSTAQLPAQSFAAYPGYRENDPTALDVGVVSFAADIGRPAMPLLLSRDARVGETAVIAGWGNDQNLVAATLRAGTATITVADPGSPTLQTQYTSNASAVCQGDSGGPLLLSEGGTWAVAGVISANSTTACVFGANYYANIRNSAITSFVLSKAPDALKR